RPRTAPAVAARAVAVSVLAGPLRWDQPLAAIGQHQQQLQPPVPAHPAQHPQLPPSQRVTQARDHHRAWQRGGHRSASLPPPARGGPAAFTPAPAKGVLGGGPGDSLGRGGPPHPPPPAPRPSPPAPPPPPPPPQRSRPPRPAGPGTAPTRPRPRPAGSPPAAA